MQSKADHALWGNAAVAHAIWQTSCLQIQHASGMHFNANGVLRAPWPALQGVNRLSTPLILAGDLGHYFWGVTSRMQ